MLEILYIVEKETEKIMAGGLETGSAEKFTCSVCGCDLFLFFGLGIYDEKILSEGSSLLLFHTEW